MMTKFSAVMVVKGGAQRQLVHPLSAIQQQYLLALGVPATYFTAPPEIARRGGQTEEPKVPWLTCAGRTARGGEAVAGWALCPSEAYARSLVRGRPP